MDKPTYKGRENSTEICIKGLQISHPNEEPGGGSTASNAQTEGFDESSTSLLWLPCQL